MLKFNRQSRLVNNSYVMTISIYDGEIITLRFCSIENQESLVYFREGEKSKLFLRQNKPTSQSRVCFISYSSLAVAGESLNLHSLFLEETFRFHDVENENEIAICHLFYAQTNGRISRSR